MIPDTDIWRYATLMINNYGEEAALEAATRADEYLAEGKIDAQRVWLGIAKAIDEFRSSRAGEIKN